MSVFGRSEIDAWLKADGSDIAMATISWLDHYSQGSDENFNQAMKNGGDANIYECQLKEIIDIKLCCGFFCAASALDKAKTFAREALDHVKASHR